MNDLFFILGLIAVWVACCFRIIRESENAVVVRLGRPIRVVKSGVCFILWPIDSLRRFTTTLIELNFGNAGVITKEKTYDGKKYGEANIGVEPTLYFRWAENEDLLETVRIIDDPTDISALTSLFEESVLDAFRTRGGDKAWREIVQDRKNFATEVLSDLLDEPADPLVQANIPRASMRLAIKHMKLPEKLQEAITKPEIARMEKEATITVAEGKRDGIILEEQGIAQARRILFDAIGIKPEDMQKEILLTLRKMAEGTSNTILFPMPGEIASTLEKIFGKSGGGKVDFKKFVSDLSTGERKTLGKILGSEK